MAAPTGASIGALRGAVDLAPLVSRASQPQPPAGGARPAPAPPTAGAASGVVIEVGDAEFSRVVELSSTVPVVVALVASWSTPSNELLPVLQRAVEALGGRMVLAVADSEANPQLAAALQAETLPTVVAVIGGRPVPLFSGPAAEEQLRPLLDQVLQLAAQNGVTGSVPIEGQAAEPTEEPAETPLPPHHADAYDAIDRGDYALAAQHFRTAIAQDPRDAAAVAALAQVELLGRLTGVDPGSARQAASEAPGDVEAQLTVADLDLSGGHVEDAFARALDLVPVTAGDQRGAVRTRLLEYFEIVGVDDPRTSAARRRLATLLY